MDIFLEERDCSFPLLEGSFVPSRCCLFTVCGTHVNSTSAAHKYMRLQRASDLGISKSLTLFSSRFYFYLIHVSSRVCPSPHFREFLSLFLSTTATGDGPIVLRKTMVYDRAKGHDTTSFSKSSSHKYSHGSARSLTLWDTVRLLRGIKPVVKIACKNSGTRGSLQMFAVMNAPELDEIDGERFKSAVTVSKARRMVKRRDDDDERTSKTLHLLRIKGSSRLSSEGELSACAHARFILQNTIRIVKYIKNKFWIIK